MSITSNPLLIISFIVITPALPKGLVAANVFVNSNPKMTVSLLACKISLYSIIFELVIFFCSFITSLIKGFFLTVSQISSHFVSIATFLCRHAVYLLNKSFNFSGLFFSISLALARCEIILLYSESLFQSTVSLTANKEGLTELLVVQLSNKSSY